jgi:serine/threonine-protein kinase HipA
MKCAAYCGLDTPNVWLSDNLEHYIVERFDIDKNGLKIGIEDLATLMGKTGDQKYIGTYENVLKAVRLNTQSIQDVEKAFHQIAYNCLIGNGDAHLKNFSLQYRPDLTSISLSPIYDVTQTLIYETLDNNMALKLKKSKVFPLKKDLIELAFSAGIPRSFAGHAIDALAQNIQDCLNTLPVVEAMEGLKKSILMNVGRIMSKVNCMN